MDGLFLCLNQWMNMNRFTQFLIWISVLALGTGALALLALNRGEQVSALWIVVAALCIHTLGYRFYSKWIAKKVLEIDPNRATPAWTKTDGKDYVPTFKSVLFGHHFAAIAGAGPLVGPVLAAQMGYLPGLLWILVGVVLAGAVQDMVILFASVRRGGKSLGEMVLEEIGPLAGLIAKLGILAIMMILIAVLGLVVVKALAHSPWGLFTIATTIPIALAMGISMRYLRPGRVLESSLWGFGLLLLSLWGGHHIANDPYWGPAFTLSGTAIAYWMIAYGALASALPVWLLLAPRDYLSTFLKIGTIAGLALGIFWVAPDLRMPAISSFIDGSGPVFSGSLFPFLFITIACGAISGFHSLISSGTTPKMLASENHIRPIGYGAMLMESFVAVMALVAACALEPGIYFALNSPSALIGSQVSEAAQKISAMGFVIRPQDLSLAATEIGESSILSRTGGAPTLALGMAEILSQVLGGSALKAFWYHFAILFEALFILTTIDAGTRVGRFMSQEILGWIWKPLGQTQNTLGNVLGTLIIAGGWGYFLVQGVKDPLGGINSLWPLFGIANQMLAVMALCLGTVLLVKMNKARMAWITLVPLLWVSCTTLSAAYQKIWSENPKIGFLKAAHNLQTALDSGKIVAPAQNAAGMQQIISNQLLDAGICALFALLLIATLALSAYQCWLHLRSSAKALPLREDAPMPRPDGAEVFD